MLKLTSRAIIFSFCVLAFLGVESSQAQLSAVCPTVRQLNGDQYKNNSPVRASRALTSNIVRFALNPTIIFIKGNPARLGRASVYDKNGNFMFTAPRLGCAARPRGTCFSRYKASEVGASNTRNVRRAAIRRTGSPEIFWKVSSDLCVRVPDAGLCYNVKRRDLCNGRVIG